jgi:flotillin
MLSKLVTQSIKYSNNKNNKMNLYPKRKFSALTDTILYSGGLSTVAVTGLLSFAAHRYKVAGPDQVLVRTGFMVPDIAISKKGFQWPFQKYKYISMHPRNYTFKLHSMSNEKIPFILPGVFTIGPKNDNDALIKYVRVLENAGNEKDGSQTIDSIILGILEGETRTLSSQLTMEQIFNDRKKLKETIIKNVQEELDQVGLHIYNANIKELEDSSESKYFYNMRQKKSSEAENNAKVDVSEARKIGDIGAKEREATTRQQVAVLEADTVLSENERNQQVEKSNAALEVVKAEAYRLRTIADIEAHKAAQMRDTDLQKDLEQKRIAMETEKMRALDVVKSQVLAEAKIKEAQGIAQALCLTSDAQLYAKQKEAQGVQALFDAQAQGMQKLMNSLGNGETALQYLMIEKDLYPRLARENALAIKGLEPKITHWNMGHSNENPLADVFKMIPPLLSNWNGQVFNSEKTKKE